MKMQVQPTKYRWTSSCKLPQILSAASAQSPSQRLYISSSCVHLYLYKDQFKGSFGAGRSSDGFYSHCFCCSTSAASQFRCAAAGPKTAKHRCRPDMSRHGCLKQPNGFCRLKQYKMYNTTQAHSMLIKGCVSVYCNALQSGFSQTHQTARTFLKTISTNLCTNETRSELKAKPLLLIWAV